MVDHSPAFQILLQIVVSMSIMDSPPTWTTVMIPSFRTDRPGQTMQTHCSMVEPHSSNFRVITTNVLGVRIFRKFTVILQLCYPLQLTSQSSVL